MLIRNWIPFMVSPLHRTSPISIHFTHFQQRHLSLLFWLHSNIGSRSHPKLLHRSRRENCRGRSVASLSKCLIQVCKSRGALSHISFSIFIFNWTVSVTKFCQECQLLLSTHKGYRHPIKRRNQSRPKPTWLPVLARRLYFIVLFDSCPLFPSRDPLSRTPISRIHKL